MCVFTHVLRKGLDVFEAYENIQRIMRVFRLPPRSR
jgi:hypothetical protein